ncbi:3-hydroxybutyrate dehydrogenase [Peribacillus frigoritolerans]|jgi:3-hydroxybutyrate dehydrogenase|uniref:3-hydroxybutyrate dehydrogenase n=1 Tax=Bacillaceae TaxID=186817 RepID=UPI00054F36EA|nr:MULTISPECIES: 3-hydroxybutyrate dehydrogenase [Bacillaceae]MBD8134410.1 3-hydroxybutyrate dehydrogenase [Bacillus sp. CFBP 13597]MBL3645676.1 3-hydroxybutyrate dehydrogenase [Bacillus sp. RHFB]MCD1158940.1 3-hydroxybutyrate dehydrogenase [Peribacillus castrilensis]MDP9739429.1 3-hydroxybutyrate dehydrogenase [Bacillus sp. B2I3]PEO43199.1 3-hydroxybutyrate dehydrogenase [Bacillus sp. AFS026049]PRS44562.1 3-hydroxybutyrate dehydrogenase [Bacillus sp. RJGP41]QNK48608.1 3-hydroxybutyrate dehy
MVKDKVAIITGSARGIGFEIGKIFAENGAKVVLSDLDQNTVEKAALDLRNNGLEVIGLKADVTSEEDIIQLIKQAKDKYGRIDIFINNAGLQHVAPIEEFPTEKFELMIKIMLTAPFISIKNVLPIMKEQGFGRIINISSINGLIGFANKAAYNSAKHGVIGLTKVAALESASFGITVNALCPGYVDTPLVRGQLEDLAKTRQVPLESVLEEVIYPLVPQNRLLDVSEIADYAIFLASDKARGITGQAVVLDGGYTAQ